MPVFPCKPRDKVPLPSLAPNGLKNATTDHDTVTQWWTLEPDANIGVVTGRIFVLDVDGEPGKAALDKLQAENAVLANTVTVATTVKTVT